MYLIPKYTKWEPALLSFYFFVGAAAIAGLTTPLTNALNAIGKIKTTLLLMVMWTTLTWIVTVIFIHFFGFQGVAFFYFSYHVYHWNSCKRDAKDRAICICKKRLKCSHIIFDTSVVVCDNSKNCSEYIRNTFFVGLSGVILYTGCIYLTDKSRVLGFIKSLRS